MATHEQTMRTDQAVPDPPLEFSDINDDGPVIRHLVKTKNPIVATVQRFLVHPQGMFVLSTVAFVVLLLLQIALLAMTASPSTEDPSRMVAGPFVRLIATLSTIAGIFVGSLVLGGTVILPASGVVGAVIGGICAGGRLLRAAIGPFLFLRTKTGIVTQTNDDWLLHGDFPLVEFKGTNDRGNGYAYMLIGYVLGILVVGGISGLAGLFVLTLVWAKNTSLWTTAFGAGVGTASIQLTVSLMGIFLFSLTNIYSQFRAGNIRYMWTLQSDSPDGEVLRQELATTHESVLGTRPRDWQSKLCTDNLDRALGLTNGEPKISGITRCLMAYQYAQDRGDAETAIRCLDVAHQIYEQLSKRERFLADFVPLTLNDESAYIAALHYRNRHHAQEWIAKLSKVTSFRWTRLRAEAAWMLVMGDATGALERAERGLALIRDYFWLDPSRMTAEAEQLEKLIERARAAGG